MLTKRLNIQEVQNRYKAATENLASFKVQVTEAIEEYESSWYHQMRLTDLESDPSYTHPRITDVEELKKIKDRSTTATALATDLLDYIDGPNDHFSWAWFSPLRSYVRDAVEDVPAHTRAAIDADMKLFSSDKSLPRAIRQTKQEIPEDELTLVKRELAAVKDKLVEQNNVIDKKNTLIESLKFTINDLLVQLSSFKNYANAAVMSFGEMLVHATQFFSRTRAKENQEEQDESMTLQHPATEFDMSQACIDPVTSKPADKILDEYEEALADLDRSVYNAVQIGNLSVAAIVFNDKETEALFSFKQQQEEALFAEQQKTAFLEQELDVVQQEFSQLQNDYAQQNDELERLKAQLQQQATATLLPPPGPIGPAAAAPPPPPPPAAPPPPAPLNVNTLPTARVTHQRRTKNEDGRNQVTETPRTPQDPEVGLKANFNDELAKTLTARAKKSEQVTYQSPVRKKAPLTRNSPGATQNFLFAGLRKKFPGKTVNTPTPKKTGAEDAADTTASADTHDSFNDTFGN